MESEKKIVIIFLTNRIDQIGILEKIRGVMSPKNPPRFLANEHSTRNRVLACFSMCNLQSCKQKWPFARKKYSDENCCKTYQNMIFMQKY